MKQIPQSNSGYLFAFSAISRVRRQWSAKNGEKKGLNLLSEKEKA